MRRAWVWLSLPWELAFPQDGGGDTTLATLAGDRAEKRLVALVFRLSGCCLWVTWCPCCVCLQRMPWPDPVPSVTGQCIPPVPTAPCSSPEVSCSTGTILHRAGEQIYNRYWGLGEDIAARVCPFLMSAPLTACCWVPFPRESLFFPAWLGLLSFFLLYQYWQQFPCISPGLLSEQNGCRESSRSCTRHWGLAEPGPAFGRGMMAGSRGVSPPTRGFGHGSQPMVLEECAMSRDGSMGF